MKVLTLPIRAGVLAGALAPWLLTTVVEADTFYVSPSGAGEACTQGEPCALSTGAALAVAGDTVILKDGTYYEPLHPENSGTADAWITFQADECALPIIEGPGEAIADDRPSGVASDTGTYLRFVGLVSRYWDSGFTNGWTGEGTTNSNGHFQYINCIGDGNGRTGMVLYSASSIVMRESISAHNGGSPTDSWSSGVQLYAVQGTPDDNIIERVVSFENTDAQENTDGSGFIVDEATQGATFINNLAFRNGGSCVRLTSSYNTRMINFSCYHNGMNPNAYSPTNPGEFYFNDQETRDSSIVINTLAAASGSTADPAVFMHPPDSGLSNNLTVDSGPTPFYSDPEGTNPDFRPPASAAPQVENQGTTDRAPDVDIGFDPKCIVNRTPDVPFRQSWWSYAIDYDYIRSIGGVAKCFHPKPRTGGVDIGAYELSGEAHAFSQPGSCVPSIEPATGGTGSGGASASGGDVGTGGSGGDGTSSGGGTPATGGMSAIGGSPATGGATGASGGSATGGSVGAGGIAASGGTIGTGGIAATGGGVDTGGTSGSGATGGAIMGTPTSGTGGGPTSVGGSTGAATAIGGSSGGALAIVNGTGGGAASAVGGMGEGAAGPGSESRGSGSDGCGCRVAGRGAERAPGSGVGLALLGLALLGCRRNGRLGR